MGKHRVVRLWFVYEKMQTKVENGERKRKEAAAQPPQNALP